MEDKITLDKAAFKALASETRVSLFKKLGNRRATPYELAQSLGVSPQAASEHLTQLEKAGLVKRDARPEDEGRKWVYYSLTEKGRALVRPEDQRRIWVLLGTGVLALAAGFSRFFIQPLSAPAFAAGVDGIGAAATQAPQVFGEQAAGALAYEVVQENGLTKAAEITVSQTPSLELFRTAASSASSSCANCGATPLELVLIVLGCMLIGASAYYYVKTRRTQKIR